MRRKEKLDPQLAKELLQEVQDPDPFPGVRGQMRTLFDQRKCDYCGGIHARSCPRVAHIEFHESGATKSVTYFHHGQWPEDHVIFLEDVIEAAAQADKDE